MYLTLALFIIIHVYVYHNTTMFYVLLQILCLQKTCPKVRKNDFVKQFAIINELVFRRDTGKKGNLHSGQSIWKTRRWKLLARNFRYFRNIFSSISFNIYKPNVFVVLSPFLFAVNDVILFEQRIYKLYVRIINTRISLNI